jgi:hypothetical protein
MHLQKKYKHAVRKQKNPCQSVLTLLGEVTDARAEWEETFDALSDGVSIHAPSGKIKRANLRSLRCLTGLLKLSSAHAAANFITTRKSRVPTTRLCAP